MVVVTCVRVSTPSSLTSSRPCAPVLFTVATKASFPSLSSSSPMVYPATASTPAARSFSTNWSSKTRLSVELMPPPSTTILRMGGPVNSVSNHADRMVVVSQPETSAASATAAHANVERKPMMHAPVGR